MLQKLHHTFALAHKEDVMGPACRVMRMNETDGLGDHDEVRQHLSGAAVDEVSGCNQCRVAMSLFLQQASLIAALLPSET